MKKNILAVTALAFMMLVGVKAYGNEPVIVDYEVIKSVVDNHPEEFRALTSRFVEADTTLTPAEVAVVYYGHAFTPQYNPEADYADVMRAFEGNDMSLTVMLAEDALKSCPVSLPMLFKVFGCSVGSDVPAIKTRADNARQRLLMICDLILSTGTGVDQMAPYLVISEGDMNEFLSKYCQVAKEISRSDLGDEKAVKVRLDGIDDDVILYFDLALARSWRKSGK